ncbi:MAG TPA: autotransporter assembly complex family protein, partial [Gammaproteobacteria bacterium]|nr:autotransporter assembly complex family protein [Gammaproteobacteria bacterium]
KRLPLKSGDVLNHGDYETAKNALRNEALARGYFDYSFSAHRIEVNTDEHWADVDLVLASGPRYRLGPVRFSKTPFDDDLLQRLVPYKAGAPYSADTVASLNGRLNNSGYFRDVRVRTLRDQASDHTIPVQVDATARQPNTVATGLGFSTDEGPRVRLSWDKHWVNSRGHQIFSDIQVSRVQRNITSRYVIPLRDPINDRLQFQAGLQSEDIQDTRSRKLTVGVQRQQEFPSGWTRTQSLQLLREDYTQADESDQATLLMPGLSFSRTRARGGLDPYWGDRQSYGVDIADDHLLSTVSMARATLSNKWLRTFGERNRVSIRLDAGAIETSDFSGVPSSLRFFAGGDQSVRGYAYQSLAPEDADGKLVGGRYLLTGSIQYGYRFLPNWRAAVFTDAGNAFNSFTVPDYKVGSGFGLHWLSPVGPVRVDFAWAVSEPGTPFRLHISLGSPL